VPRSEDGETGPARLAELTGSTVVTADTGPGSRTRCTTWQAGYRYCRRWDSVAVAGEGMAPGSRPPWLVQLRDSGAELPGCAVLVSALLDLTMRARSLRLHVSGDSPVRITELRRRVADYAGARCSPDPYLSPALRQPPRADPVQLLVGGADPLLDDSLAFAARAARSGRAGRPAGVARGDQPRHRGRHRHGRLHRDEPGDAAPVLPP